MTEPSWRSRASPKEIIKLALNDLGAHSIADLFHVLRDLNLSIAWELNSLTHRLQKQIQTNP